MSRISPDLRVVAQEKMDHAKWKQIKEALADALEMADSDRAVFVGGLSDDIRADVVRLVAAESSANDFIEAPAVFDHAVISGEPVKIPESIDEYRLVKEIGTGGMGTVYLAEKAGDGFSQKVALKVIKRGMDTDSILKRFLMERQILANLEHPNIARMIGGGSTADGVPYFVMEYVDGREIRKYADQQHLGLDERLDLFQKVCSAVANAHQKLIVHRDLKPTNILVTNDGEPKLLDFGIAKLLSPDRMNGDEPTVTQFRVMTPEYASPEQIAGEPTSTSADVYSLGVILYELLTGERPYRSRGRSPHEPVNGLFLSEPPRPSTAASGWNSRQTENVAGDTLGTQKEQQTRSAVVDPKLLQGDLDNIILKALRHEQERRYRSVEELAEDVRRYRSGLPVTATADSRAYRFQKFVARNRYVFFTSVAGAVLLVMLSAFAGWQAIRANNERAAAERRFNEVRELANYLIFDAHDRISDLPGATAARKELVEKALEYLDGLSAEAGDDMTLKRELANGYERIGDVQGGPLQANLGEYDEALKSFARAIELRDELVAKTGDHSDMYAAAMLHSKVVRILQVRNDTDAAEEHLRKAEALMEDLSALEPSNALYRVTQARFAFELGDLLSAKMDGDLALAGEQYRKSIAVCERIIPNDETTARGSDGLSLYEKALSVRQFAHRRLGQQAESDADNAAALEHYQKALEISEKFLEFFDPPSGSAQIVLAISLGNAGRMQAANGDSGEGLKKAEKMLEICERAVKNDPNNKLAQSELAAAHFSAGYVRHRQGSYDAAVESYRRAMAMQENERTAALDNVYNLGNLARTLNALGGIMEELAGRSSESSAKDEYLSKARKYYIQSRTLFTGLRTANKLPAYLSKLSEQTEQRLSVLK